MIPNLDKFIAPVAFYNSALSCLTLSISLLRNSLQLRLAESMNKNAGNSRIPAGTKIYDYSRALNFSITISEGYQISNYLNKFINNTIQDDEAIELVHYDRVLRLSVYTINQTSAKTISLDLFDNKEKRKINYKFRLNNNELLIFNDIIDCFIKYLPFISMVLSSISKVERYKNYDNNNSPDNITDEFNNPYNNSKHNLDYPNNKSNNNTYTPKYGNTPGTLPPKDIFDDNINYNTLNNDDSIENMKYKPMNNSNNSVNSEVIDDDDVPF